MKAKAAFPMQFLKGSDQGLEDGGEQFGMSTREWFAGRALEGLLAACGGGYGHYRPAKAAALAVQHADALLAELAKEVPSA